MYSDVCRRCRVPLSAGIIVILSLVTCLRLLSETSLDGGERWSWAKSERKRLKVSRRCSTLSIICLARSPPAIEWNRPDIETNFPSSSTRPRPKFPAAAGRTHPQPEAEVSKWTSSALAALRSTPQHVVLAGHSRLRQVFEVLQPLLGASLRTRGDRPPPLADSDSVLAPPQPGNSTCLAAEPSRTTRAVWCSLAADWGQVLLDFRWRHLTEPLTALLERLTARPPRRIIVAYGLHQIGLGDSRYVVKIRDLLPQLMSHLQVLQDRGTSTTVMLEAALNIYVSKFLQYPPGRGVMTMNALISEAALAARVPLWSAHLPLVQDWLLRDCRRPETAEETSRETCKTQKVHTDPTTNLRMARQLLSSMTQPWQSPDTWHSTLYDRITVLWCKHSVGIIVILESAYI